MRVLVARQVQSLLRRAHRVREPVACRPIGTIGNEPVLDLAQCIEHRAAVVQSGFFRFRALEFQVYG
jgi:hypothetical protein